MVYGEGLPPKVTLGGQQLELPRRLARRRRPRAHARRHRLLVAADLSQRVRRAERSLLRHHGHGDRVLLSSSQAPAAARADYLIANDVVTPGGIRSMENPRGVRRSRPLQHALHRRGRQRRRPHQLGHRHARLLPGDRRRHEPHVGTAACRASAPQTASRWRGCSTARSRSCMPANATFATARAATIQAAQDLYGGNSAAERALTRRGPPSASIERLSCDTHASPCCALHVVSAAAPAVRCRRRLGAATAGGFVSVINGGYQASTTSSTTASRSRSIRRPARSRRHVSDRRRRALRRRRRRPAVAGSSASASRVSRFTATASCSVVIVGAASVLLSAPSRGVGRAARASRREETGVHMQAQYSAAAVRTGCVVVAHGRSVDPARQTVDRDRRQLHARSSPTTPRRSPAWIPGATTERQTGFNVGADVQWMFTRTLGVGGLVRFTRATVDLERRQSHGLGRCRRGADRRGYQAGVLEIRAQPCPMSRQHSGFQPPARDSRVGERRHSSDPDFGNPGTLAILAMVRKVTDFTVRVLATVRRIPAGPRRDLWRRRRDRRPAGRGPRGRQHHARLQGARRAVPSRRRGGRAARRLRRRARPQARAASGRGHHGPRHTDPSFRRLPLGCRRARTSRRRSRKPNMSQSIKTRATRVGHGRRLRCQCTRPVVSRQRGARPGRGPGARRAVPARATWRAFETIYRTHSGRLYSVACRMLGNPADAEDLLQEIFLAAHRKLDSFRGESALGTWLYRLATNLCLDHLRSRAAQTASSPTRWTTSRRWRMRDRGGWRSGRWRRWISNAPWRSCPKVPHGVRAA